MSVGSHSMTNVAARSSVREILLRTASPTQPWPFFHTPSRRLRTHCCSKRHPSLNKSRLTATPSFLQTDDVTTHLLVHAGDLGCSAHAVLAIRIHRPHIVGSDSKLPPVSSTAVATRLSSCCAPSLSDSTPLLTVKLVPTFFFLHISSNSCPRSRLRVWSGEEG